MIKTQAILVSVILFLLGFIIFLGIVLLRPTPAPPELTFKYIIELSSKRMNSLNTVNLTYDINITINNSVLTGAMVFFKNKTETKVTLTPELSNYEDYTLLLTPDKITSFIQENKREEYSGELKNNNETCYSTISVPNGTVYPKMLGGDFLFVTCFDETIGYPSIVYNSEILGEEIVYSQYTLMNASYS